MDATLIRRTPRPFGRTRFLTAGAGLAFALLFHIAFLGLLVLKFARPTPVQPAVLAEAPVVSLYRVRTDSPSNAPRPSDSPAVEAAHPKAPLPVTPEPAPPNPVAQTLQLTPRPTVSASAAPPPAQASPSAPDLLNEPMPLHGQVTPAAVAGAPPAPSAGQDCHLAQVLEEKILANQALRQSIGQIPRQARSVANAVMLWDGRWTTEPLGDGRDALSVVQATLRGIIQESSVACRHQAVQGPQFITVVEPGGTTVLVVGSGVWTWDDLLR